MHVPGDVWPQTMRIQRMQAFAFLVTITAIVAAASGQTSQTLVDSQFGYKIILPAGFSENTMTLKGGNPDIVHTYVRGGLQDQKNLTLILITRMRGTLGQKSLKAEEMPAGSKATHFKTVWHGFQIDAFEVPETAGGTDFITYNAQIPLRGEAIQIGVFGAASRKAELRTIMDDVLAGLDGDSNWRSSGDSYGAGRAAGRNFGVILFVAVIVVGVIVTTLKSRRASSP